MFKLIDVNGVQVKERTFRRRNQPGEGQRVKGMRMSRDDGRMSQLVHTATVCSTAAIQFLRAFGREQLNYFPKAPDHGVNKLQQLCCVLIEIYLRGVYPDTSATGLSYPISKAARRSQLRNLIELPKWLTWVLDFVNELPSKKVEVVVVLRCKLDRDHFTSFRAVPLCRRAEWRWPTEVLRGMVDRVHRRGGETHWAG